MWHAIHVFVHCIDMVLMVSFISGIWFFAVEFEPTREYNTSEVPFSTTEEQGKHNLLSAHIWFQSIWFLYLHTIQMWFWVMVWVSCVLHSLVSYYICERWRRESEVVLNMPKGLDGRPHGNMVDCSILADTRTWVLVFVTKTKRASTWGIHFPLGSSMPSLLRESHSSGFPFACE